MSKRAESLAMLLRAASCVGTAVPGLTRGVYDDHGTPCLVGSLFTPAFRQHIVDNGWNDKVVDSSSLLVHRNTLCEYVGRERLEAETGLTVNELNQLQTMYDAHMMSDALRVYIRTMAP